MGRQRMRPVRRQQPPPPPAANATPTASARPAARRATPRPAWRETFDSYGGGWTLAILVAAILVIGGIVYSSAQNAANRAVSTDPLMGEENPTTSADHVTNASQVIIPDGQPPTAGPHFANPQGLGVYDAPIEDGRAIHSLEHGIIWITYNPDKVDAAGVKKLMEVQKAYSNDVIISPRPANKDAVDVASWRRLLKFDSVDVDQLKKFVVTNRNRSPEPGVRDNAPMNVPKS